MTDQKLIDAYMELLKDSLSPVTRSARNKVILFSTLALIVACTGVRPSDPVFLGLKFPNLTERFIVGSIGLALLYSIAHFIIHASVDRTKYVHHFDRFRNAKATDLWNNYDLREDDYEQMQREEFKQVTGYDLDKVPKQSSGCISARSFLDFYVPSIYGCISFAVLLYHFY